MDLTKEVHGFFSLKVGPIKVRVSLSGCLSPFEVVRRAIPVMAIGMITVVLSSLILLQYR
ncbi:hypothetical protein [Turicimonas muris]|uniref:hypothetical protein n=1 Tax=Turicimonas muris TaxID=1796652 RepID=UPI002494810B|nr:hypothetical protein [Turicimonas muris]